MTIRFIAMLVLASGFVAGCGGKGDAPATGGPGAGPEPAVAAAGVGAVGAPEGGADPAAAGEPAVAGGPAVSAAAARPAGTEVAFSLLDNRYLAHLYVAGGLFLPAGDPGIAKYVQGGWKAGVVLQRKMDGTPVLLPAGIQAHFRFPFDPQTCGEKCQIRYRLKPAKGDQWVSIFVNEKEYPAKQLAGGFADYALDIKAGHLVAGENVVRFHFRAAADFEGLKTAAGFAWVWVGPADAAALGEAASAKPERVAKVTLGGKALDALPLAMSGYSYHLTVPEKAQLALDVGANKAGATFAVTVVDGTSGEAREVLGTGAPADRWHPQVADLSAFSGKPVRLDLRVSVPDGVVGGFGRPEILIPAAKVEPIARKPKNVLIWVSDTLRWDRVKAYYPESRTKTPNFDALLAAGVMFEYVTVTGGHSIPSHASILTGLYPAAHGHRTDTTRVKDETELISETLQKKGFTTGIISSNGYVSDKWGFKQGWNTYLNLLRDKPPYNAEFLVPHAVKWLEQTGDKPFFLYIVSIDPHVTYNWRDAYATQYDGKQPYSGPFTDRVTGMALENIKTGKLRLTPRDKVRMEAMYDGEVTYNDHYFGVLLDAMKQRGLDKDTLVIVMSDHGDEFFEHGSCGHGHTVFDELVRVPLFMAWPGVLPAGKRIAANVEMLDLPATILDILGVEAPKEVQGVSLLPLIMRGSEPAPRAAFSEQGNAMKSAAVGNWKYILKQGDNAQLYDIAADPHEQKDVRKEKPIIDRYMRDVLAFWLAYDERWTKATWGFPNNHSAAFVNAVAP